MKQILISAGDALTAKLVEQAGFDGIWISGFEASARLGLADNGSITMSEMLNIAKPIVDAVKIPVYVDVDTGYGNFQRTVTEFEKIGVEGVCVQDDIEGQKTNSLWGGKTELMPKEEFALKIDVNKKSIKVIARTEALIRGYGMEEAKERLLMYADYGADIVLPHTRDAKLIMKDMLHMVGQDGISVKPMAIVPTKFPEYTNQQLFDMGYSMIIYANQTERVKIKAVREALKILKEEGYMLPIEKTLSASLDDMKGLTPC